MSRPRNSKGRWKSDKDITEQRMKMAAAAVLGAVAMWFFATGL
ncbi:hypothetical protein [Natrinema hispanicum]|nr:hypothetical protein [Natrinema hispanicum]